jgi:AcrR family transcriptional regulator
MWHSRPEIELSGDGMTGADSKRATRSRRSGDEVRARMLRAGREVFAELGYAGATTKQIAARAEVGEVLLFRHFSNKAGLFVEAVLDPFEAFVDQWTERWSRHAPDGDSVYELGRGYIELLYGFFDDNRQLVVALLSAQAHHPAAAARLQAMFTRLADTIREAATEYSISGRDPVTTVRLTFGMVLSMVEHAELFFIEGTRPPRDEIIDQLTDYMLYGINDPAAAATDSPRQRPRERPTR